MYNFIHLKNYVYVRDRLNLSFNQLKYDVLDGNLSKLDFDSCFKCKNIFLTTINLQNQICFIEFL